MTSTVISNSQSPRSSSEDATAPTMNPGAAVSSPANARASLAEMRPETLHRIEKAVLKLFSERDFAEVGLLEVAQQANVSLQTIYKYFGSKEALVYAMLDVMLRRLAERMMDHLQGIEDVRERLRKTFWVILDYMDRQPDVMKLLNTALPAQRFRNIPIYESPELINAFLGVLKDGQQRGVLNRRVSSKVLLDVFLGIVGRVAHMHILRSEPQPLLMQFDELFGMVWRALAVPPEDVAPPA